ncbi:hypothetical protein A2765_00105 [Candidatus Kaiserbacteria bacterium RIFCSPHIGHO2_01_FULL_56_24]|uniref:Pyruvate, phosphate dikinase n=1 Tax=Candidatus Kaiserbacteria bacterium RIFCSPHIGHO2_01_FULL_56_24 TaxID=1798487 RepID=A0A1F6DBJ6_9BACT|nr:MAG: hypothetical protein A2765_00105 [Candidatus Kaiserbacteria bacterium RIFCSPHIGHO2_01_FULL_56_24]
MSDRSRQLAYAFDEGGEETMTAAFRGGKGLGLAVLTRMGMPVPYGFTVPTGVCRAYFEHGEVPKRFDWHLDRCLSLLERKTGKRLGDPKNPLLLSVRSGAVESMPGMMDTILNIGYCKKVHAGLVKIGGKMFAEDCGKRLEKAFASAVVIPDAPADCDCDTCRRIRSEYVPPQDPREQIRKALESVFKSWQSKRAEAYRKAHGFPSWQGTAATVQEMVFGNMGDDSCTGVVFSRDVRTGARGLYGEFLPNAQGEDVVAGTHTPRPIKTLAEWSPRVYDELNVVVRKLDQHHGDIVDIEFTVERGKLFLLQCRRAKRSARAAATYAVHQVWTGVWDRREAIKYVTPTQVKELTRNTFVLATWAEAVNTRFLSKGLPASPGAAIGRAVFKASQAAELARQCEKVVLIRRDTSPNDLPGMLAAEAIVTAVGGETSHAAVVARSLNKPAVVGCGGLVIENDQYATVNGKKIRYGDFVSVSGDTGEVVLGKIEVVKPDSHGEVANFLRWVRQFEAVPVARTLPRLKFEMMERRICVNQMLNNFYLSDAMAQAARGSDLLTQAQALRSRVHTETAEFLACYLLVAVAGEIRHSSGRDWCDKLRESEQVNKAYIQLENKYGAIQSGSKDSRRTAQLKAVKMLQEKPLSDPVEFLSLCATVFDHDGWKGSSCGGIKWADIARAPLRFFTGELEHTVFADHAFDLRHNGGRMFDKHPMVSERTSDNDLQYQLEGKKKATSVTDLRNRIDHGGYETDQEVADFWTTGVSAGLWGPGKAGKYE